MEKSVRQTRSPVWSDSWITKKISHPRGNRVIHTIDEYLLNQLSLPVSFQDYRFPRKIAWFFYFPSIIPLDGIGNFLAKEWKKRSLKGEQGGSSFPCNTLSFLFSTLQSHETKEITRLASRYIVISCHILFIFFLSWSNSGNSKPCCNRLFNKIDST